MAGMTRKRKPLSEQEIDEIVIAQADDDAAWNRPVRVRRSRTAISLSPELASRAAFLARLHREANLQDWITRVIKERIDLEEAALAELKRELTVK